MEEMSIEEINKKYETSQSYVPDRPMIVNKTINTFKKLMKIKPLPDQKYCVISYFLLDPQSIVDPNNKNKSYGMWTFLGAFGTQKEAIKYAEKVILETQHSMVFATSSCTWEDLTTVDNHKDTLWVSTDTDAKLRKQHEKEYNEEINKIKLKEELDEELEAEMELEQDINSLEYYTRNWYLAIKNKSIIEDYKNKLDSMQKNFQMRIDNIKKSELSHPDYRTKWLPILKSKLSRRNEGSIYNSIEMGFNIIKDSL